MDHGEYPLGYVRLLPLNQIGEFVKYDQKSGGFKLARTGTIFQLLGRFDSSIPMEDFREVPAISVSLRLPTGEYLGIEEHTGKAISLSATGIDRIPPRAILRYTRKKFNSLSASLSYDENGVELWLRHSNFKLKFDPENAGNCFSHDASFLLRRAVSGDVAIQTQFSREAFVYKDNRYIAEESNLRIQQGGPNVIKSHIETLLQEVRLIDGDRSPAAQNGCHCQVNSVHTKK